MRVRRVRRLRRKSDAELLERARAVLLLGASGRQVAIDWWPEAPRCGAGLELGVASTLEASFRCWAGEVSSSGEAPAFGAPVAPSLDS
eukprot:3260449-Amphidinium_carterae.2